MRSKGFSAILVLLFLALFSGLVFAGYKYLGKQSSALPEEKRGAKSDMSQKALSGLELYRNEKLGIEFQYPDEYIVLQETDAAVVLGIPSISGDYAETYLTITRDQKELVDYEAYPVCSEAGSEPPCINGEVSNIFLDKIKAKDFVVNRGAIGLLYRIVQTENAPYIKLEMFIPAEELERDFQQVLDTFRFL